MTDKLSQDEFNELQRPSSTSPARKQTKTKKKPPRKASSLELKFDALIANLWPECPPMVSEYRFHPVRRWRLDRAVVDKKVGVEINGSIWKGKFGAHSSGSGLSRDYEKGNSASLEGWLILRYSSDDIKKRPEQIISDLKRALSR